MAVIPARDEAARVAATVRAAAKIPSVAQVVVIDDGSRDATARLAREAGARVVSHRRPRGKAAALETGAHAVGRSAEVLMFLDADLEDSAAEAEALVTPVVAGAADMSVAILPPQRAGSGGGHGFVVRLAADGIARATGWRATQPLCGQRCLTFDAYAAARPLAAGFGVEVGLTIDLLRKGFRVVEVPVAFEHRVTGRDWRSQLHRGRQWVHVAVALALRSALGRRRVLAHRGVLPSSPSATREDGAMTRTPGPGGAPPRLVYDGDCAFCTSSARLLQRWTRSRAEFVPWQFTDLDALGTTPARAQREVLWVGPDGRIAGGAQAVARLLIDAGRGWTVPGVLMRVPPLRWVAHLVYRAVAVNRHRLPGGTPACALPPDRRPGHGPGSGSGSGSGSADDGS